MLCKIPAENLLKNQLSLPHNISPNNLQFQKHIIITIFIKIPATKATARKKAHKTLTSLANAFVLNKTFSYFASQTSALCTAKQSNKRPENNTQGNCIYFYEISEYDNKSYNSFSPLRCSSQAEISKCNIFSRYFHFLISPAFGANFLVLLGELIYIINQFSFGKSNLYFYCVAGWKSLVG